MADKEQISLIVLSHGLWGVEGHMDYIRKRLINRYKNSIFVLNVNVNEAKYSYDGIDVCGERAAEQIINVIRQLEKSKRKVKKISLIGYSLGGLILRFAIGILGERGMFDRIEPDYFITFASPHMGVKLFDGSLRSNIFNFVSGRLVSRSGEQLQLRDRFGKKQEPIIKILSDPDEIYFKHLARFKVKRTYVNIANDRTVPYWSAGMELMDYFHNSKDRLDITLDQKYTSIVTGFDYKSHHSKKKQKTNPLRYLPFILLPIYMLFGFIVISLQGFISRHRVSNYFKNKQKLIDNRNEDDEITQMIDSKFLAGILDIVNLPEEEDEESTLLLNSCQSDDKTHYHQVSPSPCLKEKAKQLDLDAMTRTICYNLRQLEWERVWVYLDAFNAHATIICRQTNHTTDAGKANVQHFLDTTQFSV
ncbi:hypothetical protein G6F37_006388 [Rhizopus arrhizus]|nr:hypothetical protein G6F38_005973 [Rhizopus arrhizus]KAG1157793.1 hypothetical protein G6F37_006388 [Rhizopus arrhizus]